MKKNKLGQFFTKKDYWKQDQVIDFINEYNYPNILDPFAGKGDLLKYFEGSKKIIGMDIDTTFNKKWIYNDSFDKINFQEKTFVVTNPPYLSKTSSKRKAINHPAFKKNKENDLYKIALTKLLESKMPGIAIIPESFINSNFKKNNIYSITILIPNPFKDTQTPVCIICYDPKINYKKIKIYKNSEFIGYVDELQKIKEKILKPNNNIKIRFNDESGKLALIAYDSILEKKIRFLKSEDLEYKRKQKVSSRVVSKILIDIEVSNKYINDLNEKLEKYRISTQNIFLTPFKGNDKLGKRRRRLDYKTARKLINSIVLQEDTRPKISK